MLVGADRSAVQDQLVCIRTCGFWTKQDKACLIMIVRLNPNFEHMSQSSCGNTKLDCSF